MCIGPFNARKAEAIPQAKKDLHDVDTKDENNIETNTVDLKMNGMQFSHNNVMTRKESVSFVLAYDGDNHVAYIINKASQMKHPGNKSKITIIIDLMCKYPHCCNIFCMNFVIERGLIMFQLKDVGSIKS
eukprot:15366959-Ditylum_brightwellii.AAC.1